LPDNIHMVVACDGKLISIAKEIEKIDYLTEKRMTIKNFKKNFWS